MFYIASSINEDLKYSEKEINDAINNICCFNDAALIRREIYNYKFINKNPGWENLLERERTTKS